MLLDDSDSVKKECQSSCLNPPLSSSPRNDVSNKFSVDTDYKGGRESPDLNAGRYSIVSVHLELFRSRFGKHCSTKLTQIGCVASDGDCFFRSIKPSGIEDYLNNYKLGGDLLQALHMTCEDGTFLFRTRFETTEKSDNYACVEEDATLSCLLEFLQKYPNCIIVGVDEDTVAILKKRLRRVDREKVKSVVGFTYWRRVLKYLDVDNYKSVDLEEYYYENLNQVELPSFTTAVQVAKVLRNSVKDVTCKRKGGKKSMDSDSEEQEMTNEEWWAMERRRLSGVKELRLQQGGGHVTESMPEVPHAPECHCIKCKPTRQHEDGHKSERVQGKAGGRVPAPLLRREGRREAARPRHRGRR